MGIIEVKFFRDEENLYINNADGSTDKIPLTAFNVSPGLVVTVEETETAYVCDKTWREIYDHMSKGGNAVINAAENIVFAIFDCVEDSGSYGIIGDSISFGTDEPDGYPYMEKESGLG